jgi:hypothetical protein
LSYKRLFDARVHYAVLKKRAVSSCITAWPRLRLVR